MNGKQTRKVPRKTQQQLRGETPRERVLHRLHSVVLVLSGLSSSEVARIHGDSPRAVAYWVDSYSKDGVSGLEENQRPGRPSKLDAKQIKKLQTFVKQSEQKTEAINAELVAAFILAEFGISLTARQCWRILKKLQS